MKKKLVILFVIVNLFFLSSCEGYRCGSGTIYDSETKVPIDSVMCALTNGCDMQFSDSLGRYNVCDCFTGCVPDCPDITVEFSKTGYKTKSVKNPNKSDIFLDREE